MDKLLGKVYKKRVLPVSTLPGGEAFTGFQVHMVTENWASSRKETKGILETGRSDIRA